MPGRVNAFILFVFWPKRPLYALALRVREEAVILSTVSSDPAFHSDVRAVLDGRFRFDDVWDLGYEDGARLYGVKSDEQCLNVVDFVDPSRPLSLARALNGRPQITTLAVNAGSSRDEVLLMMQVGVRDVLPQFTSRDLLQSVSR